MDSDESLSEGKDNQAGRFGGRRSCGPMPVADQKRRGPDVKFLDAVVFVKLTKKTPDANLLRWLQWAKYSGVERVYMYDTGYKAMDGCAIDTPGIAEYVADGFVIIKKWDLAKWPNDRQLQIWQDVNRRFPTHHWRMYLDIDEFIFAPNDTASGFAKRYLAKMPQQVGVVSLHNFLFGGIDLLSYEVDVNESTHALPERFFYRVPDGEAESDQNTKYIAHMSRTCSLSIYFARPCEGFKVRSTMPANMRFNHYNARRTSGAKLRLQEDRLLEEPIAKAMWASAPPALKAQWRKEALIAEANAKSGGVQKIKQDPPAKDAQRSVKAPRKTVGAKKSGGQSSSAARPARSPYAKRRCRAAGNKPGVHSPNAYYFDAVVYVRLTESMPYETVTAWCLWAQYAGVDRIYMYDIGYLPSDKCVSNAPGIDKLVNSGLLVIKKWDLPKWPEDRQLHIWRDVNERYPTTQWRMYLSIEEYIFSPEDNDKGFGKRYLERTASQVGAVQLQNFVFSGDTQDVEDPKGKNTWPEKHVRRVVDGDAAKDFRTKYIAHTQRTCALLIHSARPCDAFKLRKPLPDKLRFNTYETSWQPDPTDGEKLVVDRRLAQVFDKAVKMMNHSLKDVKE